jgi:diguanylate cyclase (GGDEF)-like protein
MTSIQINHFLSLFCKELSFHIESANKRQDNISPVEFSELVSIATREVLDLYMSGELEMTEYKSDDALGYKDLALLGIDSYAQSNQTFEKITDQHAQLLDKNFSNGGIDLNTLNEKFADIQSHLSDEVARANNVILNLQTQVQNLEITSILDPLTKTFNRHALQKHFEEILSKGRNTQELFIAMLDIDNFKSINDRFGHIAGDKILIFIAKLLKKALRDGDKVYRFGGEEFLVFLNRTDLEGAELVVNRLLNLCRQNKPLFQNEQITVTLSLGLTQIHNDDTMDTLIHRADTALYRAKQNGKDRMEMEL